MMERAMNSSESDFWIGHHYFAVLLPMIAGDLL